MSASDTLPPHSPEAEQGVLGCALLDSRLVADLRLDLLYDPRNRRVADCMAAMFADGHPVSLETVYQQLKDSRQIEAVGGYAYLAQLRDKVSSPANFGYWEEILSERAMLRRVIQTAQGAITSACAPGAKGLGILESYERDVLDIRQTFSARPTGELDKCATIQELTSDYDQAVREGKPPGLAMGFDALDRLVGGLKPQQLFVIAARPSVGKTSLALNIAENMALGQKISVGFISLEMSGKELLHRLACSRTRIDSAAVNRGRIGPDDIKRLIEAFGEIRRAPLHICDRGGLALAQVAAQGRRFLQQHGIKLLIVDYLGLVRSGQRNRSLYEETSLVSNGLKELAKHLNLPVIALAQLNRDSEREGRCPRLADLRDSGAIEQDGDIIGFLHRGEDQTGDTQEVTLYVAKQRNGPTGKVPLHFHRRWTRFEGVPS